MGIISQKLMEYSARYDIDLAPGMPEQFEIYSSLLLDWNQKINLTAITEPGEVAVKHFLDSLLLLKAITVPRDASLIDVGTGAGFPGIPLKIARPDIRLTLLDSLNKRISFLTEVSKTLKQDNEIIHGRAEQCGHSPELRECFDLVTARGVAVLPALCEYCLPFVKLGGIFAALKGPDVNAEADASVQVITTFGGELLEIKSFDLPPDNKRAIVLIRKISQMPPKYPRIGVKITKKPL